MARDRPSARFLGGLLTGGGRLALPDSGNRRLPRLTPFPSCPRQVPVLCLDEATAAMDPHTEAHVLEIIERLFADRTTFTVAHR